MKLRIAFCGASGTGKSTLAKWVSETYRVPMNPVGSRLIAREMGFHSPYDVDKAGKRAAFQRRLQLKKVVWEMDHDIFVTDRTTLDDFCYMALHEVRAIDDEFLGRAFAHLNRYTHIVYCPLDVFCDPAGDPNRVQDRAYHRVFDMMIQGALKDANVERFNFITIADQDLAKRKQQIADFLAESGIAGVEGAQP